VEPFKRAGQIDVIRGLAIIGVACLHSRFEHRFNSQALSIWVLLSLLFDWAVLAFFFLSGLLLNEQQPVIDFLKKRCRSLLVPFLFYNLCYNLAFGFWQAWSGRHIPGCEWRMSLLWSGWFHSPAFQLYFLPYLFVIAAVLFCLCKWLSFRWHGWLLLIAIALMTGFYQRVGWPDRSFGPEWVRLPLYFVAFLLGIVGRRFAHEKPAPSFVLALLLCVLLAVVSRRLCLQSLLVPPLLYLAVNAIGFIRESKLLQEIGRSSAAIYLWHTPILLPAFTTVLARCKIPSIVNLGASVILTIALCIVLRRSLRAFWKRAFRIELPRSIVP